MARTKASVGAKISTGKSSKARCCVVPAASGGVSGGGDKSSRASSSGGNPVCPRETPKWQKCITNFFIEKEPRRGDDVDDGAGTSSAPMKDQKRKTKRNVIESDDENDDKNQNDDSPVKDIDVNDDIPENDGKSKNDGKTKNDAQSDNDDNSNAEILKNQELDESIHLEQLNGGKSHKIEEYYDKTSKGKGLGKKSKKNKENLDSNRRDSLKRDLEDVISDDDEGIDNKKVKLK